MGMGKLRQNKNEQKSKLSEYKIITRGLWVTSLNRATQDIIRSAT